MSATRTSTAAAAKRREDSGQRTRSRACITGPAISVGVRLRKARKRYLAMALAGSTIAVVTGRIAGGERRQFPARLPASLISNLSPEWRDYFLRILRRTPSRFSPRRLLQVDILATMRRLIAADARVLETGTGTGELLAGLPNEVRHGIDCLPEAVEHASARDAAMRITLADALTFRSPERYDAIICDRLCHTVP